MITYPEWRAKYVERYENGLYVNYNAQGLSHPKDAITVSEASGCVTRIDSSVLGARVFPTCYDAGAAPTDTVC